MMRDESKTTIGLSSSLITSCTPLVGNVSRCPILKFGILHDLVIPHTLLPLTGSPQAAKDLVVREQLGESLPDALVLIGQVGKLLGHVADPPAICVVALQAVPARQ
jgi:hypothetical protein